MESHLYQEVLKFVQTQELPFRLKTNSEKKKFTNFCKPFLDIEGKLFRTTKWKQPVQVAKYDEKEALLYLYHSDPLSGHVGKDKVYQKIRKQYYWPGLYKDVAEYVRSCHQCQFFAQKDIPLPTGSIDPTGPWERVGMDIVGPLPITNEGNRYIVTAIDYHTRWPEARALPEATAEQVAKFLYEDIICRHGIIDKIHTDQGTHFVNQIIEQLTKKFHFRHHKVTAYRPQANGLVEAFNGSLKKTLAKLSEGIDDWDTFIPPALFAYRTSVVKTIGVAPDLLTYGRSLRLPKEAIKREDIWDRLKHMVTQVPIFRQQALEQIRKAQQEDDRPVPDKFIVGDQVLLYKSWLMKGMNPKWEGPYTIIKRLNNNTYHLLKEDGSVTKPIHADRLRQYKQRIKMEPIVVIEKRL